MRDACPKEGIDVKFGFIAKHRGIWPAGWLCGALGVSRGGFYVSKGDDAVAIVQAILNLANSLKMKTTAEGVETLDQQKLLQATGCNEMQGYLFSPPRPASEILELFNSYKQPAKVGALARSGKEAVGPRARIQSIDLHQQKPKPSNAKFG
jgi:hypothetical protein